MPDPEEGKVLTQIYGAGATSPNPSGNHPASQLPPIRPPNSNSAQPNPQPNHSSSPATFVSASQPSSAQPAQPGQSIKRSRQRPTKSCERCRAKKLKCDRELPCKNCKKGGRDGRDCEYRFGPDGEEAPKAKRSRIGNERNEQSPSNGEHHVYSPQSGPIPSGGPEHSLPRPNWSNYGESVNRSLIWPGLKMLPAPAQNVSGTSTPLGRIMLKGKRSRYIGNGDTISMLDFFEHSKTFLIDAFKGPDIHAMMQELSTFQRHYAPRGKCKPEIVIPYGRDELMADMLRALPSGYLFGILQAKYISNWETVTRILHIPTFMRECGELQAAREAEPLTALPSHIPIWVVPQILAVIAIGSRLKDPSERSMSGEELSNEAITKNCLMVQRWLDDLHGKVTLYFPILQTRTLLLLARQSNLSHPSELCRRSGDLVRVAMTGGLHKDPENSDEIPKCLKEMRRKLWYTIVELDLQFSLVCGMPASITSTAFDIGKLVNVDDDEMVDEMQNYPPSKDENTWTTAIAQIAAVASIRDRLNATNLLGGCLDLERDAPALLSQAKILEQALRSLPDQFRSSTRAGNNNNKFMYRLFTSIMLDMSIRRPLLALYRTVATSPQSPRYPEARKGALRCSLAILSHLDALDPAVADLNTVKSRDYLNLFHLLCKGDIMQSVLIICYEIRQFNSSPKQESSSSSTPNLEEDSFPQNKHSLTRVVENTLNSTLQRLGEFGSDLKDILPLAVVFQSVRLDGSDEEIRESMIRGAERVLRECRKVMPSIEDAALLNSVARGNEGLLSQPQPQPQPIIPHSSWHTETTCPPTGTGQLYSGYGGAQAFGDFNLVPGDMNFADFDLNFGFTDWDMNQWI